MSLFRPPAVFGTIAIGACATFWAAFFPLECCLLCLLVSVLAAPVALYRIWPREEPNSEDGRAMNRPPKLLPHVWNCACDSCRYRAGHPARAGGAWLSTPSARAER